MWREAKIAFPDELSALNCAIVPAHPWVYGLGQIADSGNYLSPVNALAYLAKKLAVSAEETNVIVFMIAEHDHSNFMQGLSQLAEVFPAPAFKQVSRMAKAAFELSTVKMQLPSKNSGALPAAVPLSVATNRAALNAQRVAKAQIDAAVQTSTAKLQLQVGEFINARAGMLKTISDGLEALKGASANAWVFTHSGSMTNAAIELLKNIPRATAVHTVALMFIGDNLAGLEKMIHEPSRVTRS